ncbi:MAG: MG2 domain-containing protein [Candidatus Azobacteroides sp.]|nr:MG2 domain-containing protein [Candidatus Azobacteroides sp.]
MKTTYSLRLLSFLMVSVLFFSCKENKDITPSIEYAPYINAYTGGMISTSSAIRVELTSENPGVELYTETPEKLFSFTPSLKGKTYWVNNKTIEFLPDSGQLKQGELYNARFSLGKVREVEKKLKEFEFSFRVIGQNFSISLQPCDISLDNPKVATVRGEIRFSDNIRKEDAEKLLYRHINNTIVGKTELTAIDQKSYGFTISDIERQEEDVMLEVTLEGHRIGIDKKLKETTVIPGTKNFKFISARSISHPENGIQFVFSEPVSQTQDLRGLISIPELSSYVYQTQDNKVNIFFEQTNLKTVTLQIDGGIKSTQGKSLNKNTVYSLTIESLKPMVRMSAAGTILPDSKNLILPFEAVNLSAVDVRVIRIFESNVLMFMQDNTLSGSFELRRSGRLVYKSTVRLDSDPSKKLNAWDHYYIDLSHIIRQEPGAIYRIELSFQQAYSLYPCSGQITERPEIQDSELYSLVPDTFTDEEETWDIPNSYYSNSNIDWSIYKWEEKNDPCKPSYYMGYDRKVSCNVLASNLGIIAKGGSGNNLWIAVNDILTTEPVHGAEVKVYNYQLQQIGSGKTDKDGFASIEVNGKPFVLVTESGGNKSYLRLVDGEENMLSRFDVGGKEIKKGLKGFVYGERGVWRPGDTLHIGFILGDRVNKIPDNHPVTIEVYNPQGQFYARKVSTNGLNGFYTFDIETNQEDPTGLWNAYVKVGGATFHKSLRVEMIKPNRLKINLALPKRIDAAGRDISLQLTSSWLTGATARNLKTKVEMTLSTVKTQFKGYENYTFNDPASKFTTSKTQLVDGRLNDEGKINFTLKVPEAKNAPGMLQATLTSRVFEQGGDVSISSQTVPFSPFSSYVGINLNQKENSYLETDTDHVFDVITLSPEGKPLNRSNLEYKIYKMRWSWWWENNEQSYGNYINNTSIKPVDSGTLRTSGGKATISFRIDYPDWGRYLVYVKDTESGHATGGVVYIDWPTWKGRADKGDPSGLTMFTFSTDKDSYEAGETVTAIIPAAAGGRALISLENSTTVLKQEWIPVSEEGDTKYTFTVTEEMAPNFFIHASLLQPHAQTVNNLPIRMYGVVPVMVTNKNSELNPQITMPDVLRPETEFTVKVNEKSGKPMTYTLAIVDDGLLDLTNFKTPNPWDEFYSREALGIKTWDMYDYVVGAFGGKLGSLLSIGGDEMLKAGDEKANRFKPVVKFIGPFELKKGKTDTHKLTLPMYVGSVRVMVVAGQDGAYGNAEKTVPVRTPLMVLSTLPRVVSTGEEILLPVNIFAMENNVKNVNIQVETSGKLQLTEGKSKSVTFSAPGDKMVYFRLTSGAVTGIEKIKITASGNGQTATENIEIDVRNPNPVATMMTDKLLPAGSEESFPYFMSGGSGGNRAMLEVSRIPSVDISRRFDFLYDYEHHCSEQLTSKAFPLLYVSMFKDVSKEESEKISENVREAIKRLYGRQLPNGGFVYWPGNHTADEWITSYAGNFLLEAKQKGYDVNEGVINKWKAYQRREAQNWSFTPPEDARYRRYYQQDLQQAYRLYTLALAGTPELGAMNRMKEMSHISTQAKWRLAAAYAINGKTKAGNEIVWNIKSSVDPYEHNSYTYGSYDRDEAMILETMVLLNNLPEAMKQAQKVSAHMLKEYYFSTQSTAFSLIAMGRLAEKMGKGAVSFSWTLNGKAQKEVKTAKAVWQLSLPVNIKEGEVKIKNTGEGSLYVNLVTKSQPVIDTLPPVANNLRIDVSYADLNRNMIDIENLPQGMDFIALVRVSNISGSRDYTDIALTHIIPSGWEIFNERMILPVAEEGDSSPTPARQNYTYQDIRDDRILTYFDLPKGTSKIFEIRLQASYVGSFILPAIQCEAMYDTSAQARTRAGRVNVKM